MGRGFLQDHQGVKFVRTIRIPSDHWGKVWRELVASGPISRIGEEPLYVVSEQQIRLLRRKKLPFEVVAAANGKRARPQDG
jgi:hypothetical protein